MKKVLVAAAAGLMLMLAVAACKSVEDKAKDFYDWFYGIEFTGTVE